jgi:mannan endo-1,4-beta-mannosidase
VRCVVLLQELSLTDHRDFSKWMPQAISQAETAGKRLLVEEWGSKVGTDREANLATNIQLFWKL